MNAECTTSVRGAFDRKLGTGASFHAAPLASGDMTPAFEQHAEHRAAALRANSVNIERIFDRGRLGQISSVNSSFHTASRLNVASPVWR
jgi:hypothetical protein